MSTDTDPFVGELRQRLRLDDLHSGLNPEIVLTSSRRARRRRATVSSLVAAGSLAVVALAGPPLLDLRHRTSEAARDARMAQVDGLADDLGAPLHVAWRADGGFAGVSEPSGTILLRDDHGYSAVEPVTGEQLWSAEVDPTQLCELSSLYPSQKRGAGDGLERVVCSETAVGTIQVRDVATGGVVVSLSVDWPRWLADVVDGDVVAAGIDDQGRAVARRWDVETGAVMWSYRGATPLARVDASFGLSIQASAVTVSTSSEAVRLDVVRGTELPSDAVTTQGSTELAGGLRAVQEGSSESPMNVRVVDADGTELLSVPGVLHAPPADDGSMPGLIFVETGAVTSLMHAIDVHTGQELWTAAGLTPVAIIEGKLAVDNSGDVGVLDARTGVSLWRQPTSVSGHGSSVTDGDSLVSVESNSGQTNLVARALTTGVVVWAAPWNAADGTSLYVSSTGTVLVLGEDCVTSLAP